MDLSVIRIVLVDPRIPENIGMAARAMKNCGLSRLALVRGADPRQPAACRAAMDALSILETTETFADLDSAVAGSRMVVGTTRRGGQDRQPLLTPPEWIRDVLPRAAGGPPARSRDCGGARGFLPAPRGRDAPRRLPP